MIHGFKVIELFSCSTQLSMKYHLVVKAKMENYLAFRLTDAEFIKLISVLKHAKNCWHFNIYELG